MAERLKAAVLKTAERESVPWVRIPVPPPLQHCKYLYYLYLKTIILPRLTLGLTVRQVKACATALPNWYGAHAPYELISRAVSFSLVFSVSITFSCLASDTLIPPNLLRQT